MRIYKGYLISGAVGLVLGVFATTWVTNAIPNMVSRTVLKIMTGMMGMMKDMVGKEGK